jgi:hypothetical protein
VETRPAGSPVGPSGDLGAPLIRVRLELRGRGSNTGLIAALNEVAGVVEVGTEDLDEY